MFAYKDLKNILSNANLLVVLLITLSTKAKMITPKKLRFCDLFTITRLLMWLLLVTWEFIFFFIFVREWLISVLVKGINVVYVLARRSSHIHIAPMQIIFNEHPIGKLEKFIAVFYQSVKSLNNWFKYADHLTTRATHLPKHVFCLFSLTISRKKIVQF